MTAYETGKVVMAGLPHDSDLLGAIADLARENNIEVGTIIAIGAVKNARIGYYDQSAREYREQDIEEPMEISSCLGNISLKDGEIFVHAHINLADREGRVMGGHLCVGTIVFAAECRITELKGESLERSYDDITGLSLWQ
jgi:predicted DNA-binding protein with PD1-like motif